MSSVWQHFEKNQQNKSVATCKICKTSLKYSGSTGCLWTHLERHSRRPQSSTSNTAVNEAEIEKNPLFNFISRSAKRPLNPTEPQTSSFVNENPVPGSSSDQEQHGIANAKQPRITETFLSSRNINKKQEFITGAITKMVAEDMLPISFVEGTGFKNLMKMVVPQYIVPTRKTIKSRLNLLYELRKKDVLNAVNELSFVALTTDCWTSRNTESYITVTLHGITSTWEQVGYTLTTEHMKSNHTAENLRKKLEEVITTWELQEKVVAVVHDNAANIVNATKSSLYIPTSICCFAHSLQLAINKGLDLDGIKPLLGKCSSVVGHFKHSNLATNALRELQSQLKLPEHKLIQSVKTRWNSVYFMIERLLEQRQAIVGVLSNRNLTSRAQAIAYEIGENEWEVLDNLRKVLAPFATATTYMSSQSTPTVSMVQPVTSSLLANYLLSKTSDIKEIKSFKTVVSDEFKTRFNVGVLQNVQAEFLDIASFLDPRYKNKERCAGINTKVKRYLENIIEVENLSNLHNVSHNNSDYETAINVLFPDEVDNHKNNKEVEKYMLEREIPKQFSPLEWWKNNYNRYPALASIARRYLCAPATSTPAERVFSSAGNIVSAKRNALSTETVNMLVFLYQNRK